MITHLDPVPRTPERVVLLGARGFIGATLRRQLDRRHVPTLALTSDDLDLSEASAADRLTALLRPGDAMVMLAARTSDRGRDIATTIEHFAMMHSACAAAGNVGCSHFVYFSSDAVYSAADVRVTEETPPSPQDLYAAMHHTREIIARGLPGVPVLVLRPTLTYGLDDTHNSYGPNRFRREAQKDGRITLFGGGEDTRDHIHVDDVAALAVRCLLHRSTGTLNAVTGISHSFRRVAEIVARQFKSTVEIVETPRATPVTHRRYDIAATIEAFPDIRFSGLEEGIARVHREMLGDD